MDSTKLVPYIPDSKLKDYAASCALAMTELSMAKGKCEAAVLKKSMQSISHCHHMLSRRYEGRTDIPPACEWLLDNYYILLREYPSCLSLIRNAPRQRCHRNRLMLSELCRTLLQSGQGRLDEGRCKIFLEGFQSVINLQRAELMLFPAVLRAVIFEALARCCESLMSSSVPDQFADSFAALFSSLRLLSHMDMESLLDDADITGRILALDPSGDYRKMDRPTKALYLEKLSQMADREGMDQQSLAKRLMSKASSEKRHIGFLLFTDKGRAGAAVYISFICLSSLFLSLYISYGSGSLASIPLLIFPCWSMIKRLVDFVLLHIIHPRPLPRMDLSDGIPESGKSICVISALLGCVDYSRLEQLRLASRQEGKNLSFGILADLPASRQADSPEDEKLLSEARQSIEMLNQKYGGGFYLFCRSRSFDGDTYSGKERKRGAILELAKLLCGESSTLELCGDRAALHGTKYIISLDADTRIYPGSLSRLIAAALHPLCRPVIDEKSHVVKSGHAIIHPRIETELESATATDFALIFSGGGGSDPYGGLCTELYMDAFGNGGFAGKGLIDAQALLECTASRFPEGCILSHDALEGAYLRGAYMSDVEFSDAFPSSALSYYKRQHRWIRGDWQNAPWLFAGELSPMDRFRLFDSLRRSLSPAATLAAIIAGFFISGTGLRLAAWAAFLSVMQSLLLSLAESSLAPADSTKLRRHTRLLNGVGGALLRCFMQLWLLPYEAWISLSAACTALWRMLVSRKKLLQWQTFAQSGSGADFAGHVKSMWPAMVLGIVLMAFSPLIIGKASGFMWLLSPAAAWALALPAYREAELGIRDRELLHTSVSDHWHYLKDLARKEDNFLPPDNFQQQPPVGIAHRSSPTNIGLALAAAASAACSGIIKQREAVSYISKMLPALENMPKFKGHFYNWYDTRSLRPLSPAHLSSVDSGNMYAGLLVCAAALESWGRFELAGRLRAMMAGMDFSIFYDKNKELLYISYNPHTQKGVGGWYDLMASEAMLTSYLAVARGDVPLKHWRRLSRAQLQKDGYRGLASWTGTMFEYLMPALFLPIYRSSLLYESDRFCLYAQKRRRYPGKPWGISESAFYSLDPGMSFRYKAHGCPALALKRGQEKDMVIAPYASFLALAVESRSAAKNLRHLKDLGAYGRWGFIEALDFTPGRCSREDGEQLRCWMAHHVSMSILAALNALDGGIVRRLFLSSPDMAAHTLLLQEKLPASGAIIRRAEGNLPERPRQGLRRPWSVKGGMEDQIPFACLLSNGAYGIRVGKEGESTAYSGDICIYRHDDNFGLNISIDGKKLFPAQSFDSWELAEDHVFCNFRLDGIELSINRACAEGELGEIIDLELNSDSSRHIMLELSLIPVLARLQDYESHPAYWKLGIVATEAPGELMLHRLKKSDNRELWCCIVCTENVLFSADEKGGTGSLVSPKLRAAAAISVKPAIPHRLRFALCTGSTEDDARSAALRTLNSHGPAMGNMAGAAAIKLGMTQAEFGKAMELVLPLWKNRLSKAPAQSELWQWGISGDLPIICCESNSAETDRLIKSFCLLKSCGMDTELVFLSRESGEYMQPFMRHVEQQLSGFGLEALIGSPGGIFIVPESGAHIITGRAAVSIGLGKPLPPALPRFFDSGRRNPAHIPDFKWQDSSFQYSCRQGYTPRIWQHILTNSSLSALAADFGPAGLWYKNAREMKLIAPPADISAVVGDEQIYVLYEGKKYSLFAADDGIACHVSYEPGISRWTKQIGPKKIESCMFIHPDCDARLITISGAQGMELFWEARPHMGNVSSAALNSRSEDGCIIFENAESYYQGLRFAFFVSAEFEAETDFCPGAVRMRMQAGESTVLVCGCVESGILKSLCHNAIAIVKASSDHWKSTACRLKLCCGDNAIEHYMNTWAVYQSLACRMLARGSIYQSGGAIGFRDQLQDSINLMLIDPGLARQQLLLCCRHQYTEGDVMHWWHPHPDGDKGIRSRCSDDLLWLVWAACEYYEATGDRQLIDSKEAFLNSPPLKSDESDRYEKPPFSDESATVLEHCKRALDCCIDRGFGVHGLPWIGSGDWNDGMNAVDGESLWLGWFLSHCAQRFAALLRELGESGYEVYEEVAKKVGLAADACHNGRWYPRAFYKDGSAIADGDRIDSIAQSWAVFCPWSSEEKLRKSLGFALKELWIRDKAVIRLLSPPYSPLERSPGYITGYGQGFRENGGQYTHAAIWLALAAMKQGLSEEGWEILRQLLPENHRPEIYAAEPYVLAADVSSARGHTGLAGWTWYTGSAGWYFRVVASELLGLKMHKGRLYIRPCLPPSLPGFELEYKSPGGRLLSIRFRAGNITVNGKPYSGEGLEI